MTISTSDARRPNGPNVSTDGASGRTPVLSNSPYVGRNPTRAWTRAGPRTEPKESVPNPNAARLAATAAPEPLLDAAGIARQSVQHVVKRRVRRPRRF